MAMSKQTHHVVVSETPPALRERAGKETKSDPVGLPWTEAELKALLRVVPDHVFRIGLQPDGSVTVMGDRSAMEIPASELADLDGRSGGEDQPEDAARGLCRELARQARGLMAGFVRTGEVQVIDLQIERKGRMACHQVRAVACGNAEILALVKDVTAGKRTADGAAAPSGELSRLDQILHNQVSSYVEDEEVLRDVSVKLNTLLEDTIGAIQTVVQKKDPSTARHQARVWKLACAIGREMGLGKTRVAIIGLAALVHDFGKVFIPTDILNKPGKLSEAEFAAVKGHADAVFQVLSTIDMFCPIADIVHQHHERMNGSGYPLGLKGEEIILEARIIAVADVVEAMLSARPHRPALGVDAAMKEIAMGKGTLYDADAVDACIRLFTVGKFEFDPEAGVYDGPPSLEPKRPAAEPH
jgi:HD-GYP domain-containing protein (c-di-GMP phosphodiesterase class II)